jgi:metacaspase-1
MAIEQAHALVVGIAAYEQINPLPGAVRSDALAVQDVLVDPGLCGYAPGNVTVLVDGAATLVGVAGWQS